MPRVLDPRTKLVMIVLPAIMLAIGMPLPLEIVMTVLFVLPFFVAREFLKGVGFLIIYALQLLALFFLTPYIHHPFLLYILSFFAIGTRRMLISIVAGVYALTTTRMDEWLALFRQWRIPSSVTIPLLVMVRFFPGVYEDYKNIRQAMAFRGLAQGPLGMLRNPGATLEYVLMPLLMNASQVADDLTVAALTKGITHPNMATSLVALKQTTFDWIFLAVVVAVFAAGKVML